MCPLLPHYHLPRVPEKVSGAVPHFFLGEERGGGPKTHHLPLAQEEEEDRTCRRLNFDKKVTFAILREGALVFYIRFLDNYFPFQFAIGDSLTPCSEVPNGGRRRGDEEKEREKMGFLRSANDPPFPKKKKKETAADNFLPH